MYKLSPRKDRVYRTSSQLEPCAVCICVSNACPRGTESRTRVCTDLRFITQTRPLAAPDKVYMGVLGILDARGPVVLNLQKCFARAAISRFQIRRCERVRRVQNCSRKLVQKYFLLYLLLCLYCFFTSLLILITEYTHVYTGCRVRHVQWTRHVARIAPRFWKFSHTALQYQAHGFLPAITAEHPGV